MNAAITNVYIVIAVCRPTTVVFRSATTCVIDTFITVVSSTMTNWAVARIAATPQPTFFTAAGADATPALDPRRRSPLLMRSRQALAPSPVGVAPASSLPAATWAL